MPHLVLFVCTGNVCRSPIAAALFNDYARRAGDANEYHALSAGTWAPENQPASGFAINVMARRALDLTGHRARTITERDMGAADVVVVMTQNHREALAAEFPQFSHKIHMLSDVNGARIDIGDPYGGSLAEYEHCAQEIQRYLGVGYQQIKQWALTASA